MTTPDIRVQAVNARPTKPRGDYVLVLDGGRAPHPLELCAAAGGRVGPTTGKAPGRCSRRSGSPTPGERPPARVRPARHGRQRAQPRGFWRLLLPYVEREPNEGKGLLTALAARAALVVTDDFPAFFLRRMVAAAGRRIDVRLEAIDSNGLLPLRGADRVFPTAYAFRFFLQKHLRPHLASFPEADPVGEARLVRAGEIPSAITRGGRVPTPPARREPAALRRLPIDHTVGAVATRGGTQAGRACSRDSSATGSPVRGRAQSAGRRGRERPLTVPALRTRLSPRGLCRAHDPGAMDDTVDRRQGHRKREGWWGASPLPRRFSTSS